LSTWVVDSSVALALVLPDERSTRAEVLLRARRRPTLIAPPLWLYETANALTVAVRRRRLPEAALAEACDLLAALEVDIDGRVEPALGRTLQAIGLATELSAYDAAYLELAERRAPARLATIDTRLARVAAARGIRGLPARR
jgi:predicted nucleic acid-binding protein